MLHHVVDGLLDGGDLLGFLIGDLHPELLLELHNELHQIQRVSLQILAEGSVGCDVAFINSQPVGGDLLYLAEYPFAIQGFSPLQGSYKLQLTHPNNSAECKPKTPYCIVMPPSTATVWPVTYPASSPTRKATTPATSSASANLPAGT